MLRTALTPRFLGLLGLVLVLCATFVWLGRWQLGVAESSAHRDAVEQARSQAPAELTTLLQPHAPFRGDLSSRPFTATGHYDADGPAARARVAGSRAGPACGCSRRSSLDRGGATLPVVRGFVHGCRVGAAPAGGHPDDRGRPGAGGVALTRPGAVGPDRVGRPLAAGQQLAR